MFYVFLYFSFAAITHVKVYFIIIYPVTDGNKDKIYLPTAKPLTKVTLYVQLFETHFRFFALKLSLSFCYVQFIFLALFT